MKRPRPVDPRMMVFLGAILVFAAIAPAGCSGGKTAVPPPAGAPAASAGAPQAPPEPAAAVDAPPGSPVDRLMRERWTGDLDGIVKRRYLRVLVIPDRMYFFFDGREMRGVTYEAMRGFESFLNTRMKTGKLPVSFAFIPVNRDEILPALIDGRGDIAASGLAITPERLALVDFSDPVRDHVSAIPVTGPRTPPLKSLEDLAGREVYVPQSSVFPAILKAVNERLRQGGATRRSSPSPLTMPARR